jgi:hypothetical protein
VDTEVIRTMNIRMERLLPTLQPRDVPAEVRAALEDGVVEVGPYLFLRSEARRLDGTPDPNPDATGVEVFHNHVHPDEAGWDAIACAEAGMTALGLLRGKLIAYKRSGPVQVVLSVGFHEYPSSSLRFYRRRPGERWIVDDLETYKSEAILVEDIR